MCSCVCVCVCVGGGEVRHRELLMRYQGAFHINSRNRGEELCDALLQAVAFYELLTE